MSDAPLDLLTPTSPKTGSHGVFYGHVVRGARYLLGLGILSVIAVVFLWPDMRKAPATPPDVAGIDTATNRLEHPQFDAVDKDGQPYRLRAQTAIQDKANPDRIDLVAPIGVIDLKNGKKIGLVGESGIYAQEKKVMNLSGKVKLIENQGMQLDTQQMTIDLQAGTVTASGPVTAAGPMGTLRANGMTGTQETGILIFKGPATLTLPEGSMK